MKRPSSYYVKNELIGSQPMPSDEQPTTSGELTKDFSENISNTVVSELKQVDSNTVLKTNLSISEQSYRLLKHRYEEARVNFEMASKELEEYASIFSENAIRRFEQELTVK